VEAEAFDFLRSRKHFS